MTGWSVASLQAAALDLQRQGGGDLDAGGAVVPFDSRLTLPRSVCLSRLFADGSVAKPNSGALIEVVGAAHGLTPAEQRKIPYYRGQGMMAALRDVTLFGQPAGTEGLFYKLRADAALRGVHGVRIAAANVVLERVVALGLDAGFITGERCWINDLYSCHARRCRTGVNLSPDPTSGERIDWWGGSISGCHVGIQNGTAKRPEGVPFRVHGASIDYNLTAHVRSYRITVLDGCHVEHLDGPEATRMTVGSGRLEMRFCRVLDNLATVPFFAVGGAGELVLTGNQWPAKRPEPLWKVAGRGRVVES